MNLHVGTLNVTLSPCNSISQLKAQSRNDFKLFFVTISLEILDEVNFVCGQPRTFLYVFRNLWKPSKWTSTQQWWLELSAEIIRRRSHLENSVFKRNMKQTNKERVPLSQISTICELSMYMEVSWKFRAINEAIANMTKYLNNRARYSVTRNFPENVCEDCYCSRFCIQ